jgi:5-formyltetrahydrofolate cyclo-ligase
VAAYEALPGEVDLSPLLAALEHVALPRIDGDVVTWHRDDGRGEPHRFGMRQPPADAPAVEPSELDVVLVPGRAFDRYGTRLGRGGGHYDRLLPRLRPGVAVIGVTVDERVVPGLPTEAHDAPMTHLATQTGVRAVRSPHGT